MSQVPLLAAKQQNTTRENKVKRLFEKFETHKHEESLIQDLSQTKKISKFSKESQDLITDMNNTEILGVWENSSKQQSPNCNAYWEKGKSIAVVEEMLNLRGVQRSSTRTTETSPQSLDTWSRRTAVVEPSTDFLKDKSCTTRRKRRLKKGPTGKARMPSNNTFTMVRRRRVQKVIVSHWVEREPHNIIRQNRRGEAHLPRYKSWKKSKFEALDSHDKCRRISANTQSTTRLCSSKKRMQTIARRAPGKDPRRKQDHSSQSTKKTAKRTTIWGQRRKSLRGGPENRLEVLQRVAEKPADNFVRITGQPADSFVIVVTVGPNPVEYEQLVFLAFFKPWLLVNIFLRVRTGFG